MKKRVTLLLLGLTVLYNFGCTKTSLVYEYNCPSPPKPELPKLDEKKYIEDPINIEILMYRDDIMRLYINALQETIICYDDVAKQKE